LAVEKAEELWNIAKNDEQLMKLLAENEVTAGLTTDEIALRVVNKYRKISRVWNELLPKLKDKYRLAIINNGMGLTIPYFKKENNFEEYFEFFINSSEEGISKPDAEIFLLACRRLGVGPEECVFVDDVERNVKGAENIGMTGIVYKGYEDFAQQLFGKIKG
jgi:epoxide hydrolase-like predicted phosphatase